MIHEDRDNDFQRKKKKTKKQKGEQKNLWICMESGDTPAWKR